MSKKQTVLTDADKEELLSYTPKVLPDNPSNKGFSADQIKRKMYEGYIVLFNLLNRAIQENNENVDLVDQAIADAITTVSGLVSAEAIRATGAETALGIRIDNIGQNATASKYYKQDGVTQEFIYAIENALSTHSSNTNNPHSVTKAQVGLGNVDNTSDMSKPISTLVQIALNAITAVIPNTATSSNKLADEAFVNSTVATQTANFLSTLDVVTDLGLQYGAGHQAVATALNSYSFATKTNNDYCYAVNKDSDNNTVYERYKWKENQNTFSWEYSLNNSSFTAQQWASINSGITANKVTAYDAYETSKQNAITNANKLSADLVDDSASSNKFFPARVYNYGVTGKFNEMKELWENGTPLFAYNGGSHRALIPCIYCDSNQIVFSGIDSYLNRTISYFYYSGSGSWDSGSGSSLTSNGGERNLLPMSGTADPIASTNATVGQFYLNTTENTLWLCIAKNSSNVRTWVPVSSSGGGTVIGAKDSTGASFTVTDGYIIVPRASLNGLGLSKIGGDLGIAITQNGEYYVDYASEQEIINKQGSYKAITPQNIRHAIREGLGGAYQTVEWSDQYKQTARTVIGALASGFVTLQTTAPTADITDGGVHIVVLTSEPATKYSGYIYFVEEQ